MANLSNYEKVLKLFKPNPEGISDWISIDRFSEVGLNWSNNGNQRHGVFFNVSEYFWEKKGVRSVSHLRTAGLNKADSFSQNISSRIKNHFVGDNLCSLSLLPIPNQLREIDHRFGNKSHPDYVELYKVENQQSEHFQLIYSVLNSAKRQMCIDCCQSQIRPPHPTLGFVEGDESHAEHFPCKGCYLAEPERYREISR